MCCCTSVVLLTAKVELSMTFVYCKIVSQKTKLFMSPQFLNKLFLLSVFVSSFSSLSIYFEIRNLKKKWRPMRYFLIFIAFLCSTR